MYIYIHACFRSAVNHWFITRQYNILYKQHTYFCSFGLIALYIINVQIDCPVHAT